MRGCRQVLARRSHSRVIRSASAISSAAATRQNSQSSASIARATAPCSGAGPNGQPTGSR
jgi:hypothetical protein